MKSSTKKDRAATKSLHNSFPLFQFSLMKLGGISYYITMYKKTQVNAQTRGILDAWSIHQLSSDIHKIQDPCARQNIIWILPITSWHLELGNTTLGITYMVHLQRSWRTFKDTTTSDGHKCMWRLHHPWTQLFQTYRLQPHEESWWQSCFWC